MIRCTDCIFSGYCRKRRSSLVNDGELRNPEFIRDVRAKANSLNICSDHWLEFLTGLYRDYPGWIMDAGGDEVFLDMEEFELPNIKVWFQEFCCTPCPPHVQPRVRVEARERVRALATILRACFPVEAYFWGRRPANDNAPDDGE